MITLTVFLFKRLYASRERRRSNEQLARIAKKAVSEFAFQDETTAPSSLAEEKLLSESAVFASEEMLSYLISRRDLDAAEMWAENTLPTNPKHFRVAVRLAEIHHQRGERKNFFDVLNEYVIAHRDELGTETRSHLEGMLQDFSQSASGAH